MPGSSIGGVCEVVGCKMGSLTTTNLELLLCGGSTSKGLWDIVRGRMERKLST